MLLRISLGYHSWIADVILSVILSSRFKSVHFRAGEGRTLFVVVRVDDERL